MLICGYDDCPNETFKSGLCKEHHLAWGLHDPQVLAYFRARPGGRKSGTMCLCGIKAVVRGFCQNCYQKHKAKIPKFTRCSVEGCGNQALVKGLCSPHYSRARAYGSPTAAKPLFSKQRRDFTGIKFGKITVVSANPDGSWNCRCDCGNENVIKSHKKIGEAINAGSDSYCSMCNSEQNLTRIREGIVRRTTNGYRFGATSRGFSFDLTQDDMEKIIFLPCQYCGWDKDKEYRGTFFCGVDRPDNTIGYRIGNAVPCCTTCNFAKRDLSQADWEAWLTRVVRYRTS